MPKRNTVWVLDRSGSQYSAAQPLLATKGIDLLIFSRDNHSPISRENIEKTVAEFGAPDLLIFSDTYLIEKNLVLSHLETEPVVWNESPSSTDNPSELSELIDLLVEYFWNTQIKTNIELNKSRNLVEINGKKIKLTTREFEILDHLLVAPSHTVSRSDFFNSVWSGLKVCNKVLDVHVSNLRRKVRPHGIKIRFVRPGSFEIIFP